MSTNNVGLRRLTTAVTIFLCTIAGCFCATFYSGNPDPILNDVQFAASSATGTLVSGTTPTALGRQQEDDEKLKAAIAKANKNYAEKMANFPPREDLVKDWEQPDVTFFITGRVHGYIEPCGCTGLDTQKGGLLRRYNALKIIKDKGWQPVTIDAGNQVRRFGQQPLIKLQKIYQAICNTMDYDVVGFGVDDFKMPTIDLMQSMMNAQQAVNPFTCGNVVMFGAQDMTNSFRIIERNGKKIGVTCILGDEHHPALVNQTDLTVKGMAEALQEITPQLKNANCDMTILVAQANLNDCRQMAQQFPFFDLLVTAGGAGDPTLEPEMIAGQNGHVTRMIQVGVKGMYFGVVGLYPPAADGQKQIKYERVELDYRFEPSIDEINPVKDIFQAYQDELKATYFRPVEENGQIVFKTNNQDIRPRDHSSGNTFVGTESCIDCHEDEYDIWLEGADLAGVGPHSRATLDLTEPGERTWQPRNFDPECLCCHVTGWNPTQEGGMYPYVSGYLDLEEHEYLHGSGCENCHGPGSAHVASENNPNSLANDFQRWDANRDGGIDQNELARMLQNTSMQVANAGPIMQEFDLNKDIRLSVDEFIQYRLGVLRKEMELTIEQAKDGFCRRCHDLDNSPDYAIPPDGFEKYWPKIKHGGG